MHARVDRGRGNLAIVGALAAMGGGHLLSALGSPVEDAYPRFGRQRVSKYSPKRCIQIRANTRRLRQKYAGQLDYSASTACIDRCIGRINADVRNSECHAPDGVRFSIEEFLTVPEYV